MHDNALPPYSARSSAAMILTVYDRQILVFLNSSSSSATYMWTGSSLVQVMTCLLFGAKPLPGPMLAYCQLESWELISVKFESEFCHFHSRKCLWKCCPPKWCPFCPSGDEVRIIFNSLHHFNIKEWYKMQTLSYIFKNNSECENVTQWGSHDSLCSPLISVQT